MRLKADINPHSLVERKIKSPAINNSTRGTIQDTQDAKALKRGDCPSCTWKFSKSSSLLIAA